MLIWETQSYTAQFRFELSAFKGKLLRRHYYKVFKPFVISWIQHQDAMSTFLCSYCWAIIHRYNSYAYTNNFVDWSAKNRWAAIIRLAVKVGGVEGNYDYDHQAVSNWNI